jgi:signal transduction histidine kinase
VLLLSAAAPIEAAKREARRRVLIVAAIGLLLALCLAAILALTVTRPIRRLAAAAAGVREGEERPEFPEGGGPEIRAVRDALVEMIGRLDRYREELVAREKMATLGRFSAAVAHEIRNPLSSMRMTLELLADDADESLEQEIDFLRAEAARLDHSVEELLFHAGEPRYEMAAIALSDVVDRARQMLEPLANHLGVDLSAEAEEIPVTGDANRLRQALVNLGLNALQASEPGGRVSIVATSDGGGAVLAVRDGGPGVPAEIADRIFEPFVTGRPGGTGLGLAVTAAIAEAHGGRVTHERTGDETIFTLRLPAGER